MIVEVFPMTRPSSAYLANINFLVIAALLSALMAGVSWFLAGAPGMNGIDDAAITRSYSENIANGHGFVYNIGGERVEGATSVLWTLIVAIPYLFDENPEYPILAITFALTVVGLVLAFRIIARACGREHALLPALLCALLLCGLPSFFVWSIWSMMEVALWVTLILLLTDRLSRLSELETPAPRLDAALLIAAVLLPLTRPEGIAVTVGLCLLAIVMRPRLLRPVGVAVVAAIVSFAALIGGRLAYFGYPFPNTYYAKVSADRLQNVADGAKYLLSFVLEQPFAEMLLVGWIVLLTWAILRLLRENKAGSRTIILSGAVVFGLLLTYVMLGGDHFALWRFYQPILPLFGLPIVVLMMWLSRTLVDQRWMAIAVAPVLAFAGWILVNYASYYQARFAIAKEFKLSKRGEDFGTYMNQFTPLPSMGITAAGGIALTYDGELRDLLGLNWVEMAHANPMKVGFRNHASFDLDTFWRHPPELLPLYHKTKCQRENWAERSSEKEAGVKQLFVQERFQADYVPVILERDNGRCTNAFASPSWLEAVESDRITVLDWADITLVGAER